VKSLKNEPVLVTVLPMSEVKRQYGRACGKSQPCTPWCTNTPYPTTTEVTRVAAGELAELRKMLRALQAK
jgi:hypothetical protein